MSTRGWPVISVKAASSLFCGKVSAAAGGESWTR
jgi:hypothetical protein